MADLSLLAIFLMGFLGGSHCVGMCGGFGSALTLHLPPTTRRWPWLVCLNFGRLGSYILIGFLLGALSQYGIGLDQTQGLQIVLRITANVILLLFALHLGAWSSWLQHIERLGLPVWKRLNPHLNRLLPIQSKVAAFQVGVLWGWLPCGLVYSASSYALASGEALQGAWVMAVFGLGTLPNLLALSWVTVPLRTYLQKLWLRRLIATAMMAWALWQLLGLWAWLHD